MAHDPIPPMARNNFAIGYLLPWGRADEAVQQMDLALREDPLNSVLRYGRALCLTAAGRDEDASKAFRDVLEFNPAMAQAIANLATLHVLRGELDQALAFAEKAYAIMPSVPNHIGLLAGLLMRTGDTRRADELLQKLQPGDAYGAPRGLAIYHWVLREFDAEAEWIEKAIDQHDPNAVLYPWLRYGRELRTTPRWAGLMRKLNLPES